MPHDGPRSISTDAFGLFFPGRMLRQATAATATAAALLLALGSSSAFVNPGPAALFQQQPQQLQRGCSAQGQAYALFDFFGGGSKKKSSDAGAAAAVDAAAAAAPKKPPGAVIPDKGECESLKRGKDGGERSTGAAICGGSGFLPYMRDVAQAAVHQKHTELAFLFLAGTPPTSDYWVSIFHDRIDAFTHTRARAPGPKLPVLYNGWFDGSIVNDMASAVKAAVKDRVPFAEIICPPIPNIEELDFGTALNQRYNKEVAARLKAPENVVRKASLAYANVDWANRVAQKIGKRTLLCAFDATVPPAGVTLCKNAECVPCALCVQMST